MQPAFNLKSFLAVLTILIVPAALLVAYFRNYSAEGGGHAHGGVAASIKSSGDMNAMNPSGPSHTERGHGNMAMMQGSTTPQDKDTEPQQRTAAQTRKGGVHADMESGKMEPPGVGGIPEPTHAVSVNEQLDMAKSSRLPGIPGVTRLYHVGATDFFLNHMEYLTLSTKQQTVLNRLKQKALLSKSTVRRQIEESEQELWELTGADEPDASQIEAKVQAIAKLRGDRRLAFIHSVGEAVKVLTDEQRQILLGNNRTTAPEAHPPTRK